ncbi:hypothetical protein [Propioniciclava soli]|uniref:hypothetical protein n=1 Tax=Propioniciclava soli TaxID=2775081 RepID=UPI001E2BAD2D|nr:hypothetical protein [Propioniciclava soli]
MSASDLQTLLLLAIALLAGTLAVIMALKKPWWAAVVAVASLPLVPYWVGVSVAIFYVPASLGLAFLATIAILRRGTARPRLGAVDAALLALLALVLLAFLLRLVTIAQAYAFVQWFTIYAFARVAASAYGVRRLATVFVTTAAVAAGFILLEAATGINVWARFVRFGGLYSTWGTLQYRGGVLRAEGAFGHSIAAGGSLAVAAVLALDARLKLGQRLGLVALLLAATLATFSRLGMATAAAGVAVALLAGRFDLSRRARAALLGVLAVSAIFFVLFLSSVFAESGSEAANSAAYRTWLLELVPTTQPLGTADSYARTTDGRVTYGAFRSIDSALLLFALAYGWLPTIVVIALATLSVAWALSFRAGTAAIAVAAQAASLTSVALITQYGLIFWLAVGWAVTEVLQRRPIPSPAPEGLVVGSAGPPVPQARVREEPVGC